MESRRHGGRHGGRRARVTEAVFVDQSGRRRRLLTIIGAAVAVVLLLGLGVLGVGLITGGKVPLPGWPDSGVQADDGGPVPSAEATPAPEPVGLASTAPTGAPVATPDNPGQGYLHKNTARPTRSAGKPG